MRSHPMTKLTAQLTRYAPGQRMGPHSDGCRRLSIVVSGEVLESDRQRTERPRAGSVGLKAPRFQHSDRYGDAGALIVSVILPDVQVRKLGLDPDRLVPWRWCHSAETAVSAWRLAAGLSERDPALSGQGLSLLLRRFARRLDPRAVPARVRRVRGLLHDELGRGFVADGTGSPRITVDAIAEREGIHPVSLGRLFRRHMGCSITRYRQRLRLHAALRCLLGHDRDLVDVALQHGYSDLSHMTRLAKAEVGIPPGRLRRAMRGLTQGLDSFKTEWTFSI